MARITNEELQKAIFQPNKEVALENPLTDTKRDVTSYTIHGDETKESAKEVMPRWLD